MRRNLADKMMPTVAIFCGDALSTACPAIRLVRPLEKSGWKLRSGAEYFRNVIDVDLNAANGADAIVIQRNFPSQNTYASLRYLAATGIPLIYDIDDAFLDIPENHLGYTHYDSLRPYIKWMLTQADLITASTNYLAESLRKYTSRRIAVQPNLVDWQLFDAHPRRQEHICHILVAGTQSHREDWKLIETPILQILANQTAAVRFIFLGDVPERLKNNPRVESLPFESNYKSYAKVLQTLPVQLALIPLVDTPFNRAKSNIKWLEYSAAGIPGIYSDVEPYNNCVRSGIDGILVNNSVEAWTHAISSLMYDSVQRLSLINEARTRVSTQHSIDAGLSNYIDIFANQIGRPHKKQFAGEIDIFSLHVGRRALRILDQRLLWRLRR